MIYLDKQFAVEDGLLHLKCGRVVAILDRANCLKCNKQVSLELVAKARLLGAKVEDIKDIDFDDLEDYSNVISKEIFVRFAILCAESVLSTFEEKHNDARPRGAIQAAKDWLANPTEENRLAAAAAANAAARSATGARSAAAAARSAAARSAAAYSAAAYAAACSAAAYAAACSADLRAFWHKALIWPQ